LFEEEVRNFVFEIGFLVKERRTGNRKNGEFIGLLSLLYILAKPILLIQNIVSFQKENK